MLRKRLFAVATIFTLAITLVACGGNANTEKQFITSSEIDVLHTNANTLKGKYVELIGKIFKVEKKEKEIVIQMWNDIENNDRNTIVRYTDMSSDLKEKDYIKVVGKILGNYTGTNSFGEKLTVPEIAAESVTAVSYKDALSPTIKEVVSENASVAQLGITIAVSKVEFAKNETRLYITVKNDSNNTFNLYSSSVMITQNGKQYEEQYNYQADYKKLSSTILPGVSADGVLAFPTLEQSKFNIILKGSSSDYGQTFKDVNIEINF